MSAEPAFLDTNVFIYCFDQGNLDKRDRARALVGDALENFTTATSYQVVQEALNVATTKFKTPMNASEASRYLHETLMPLCRVYPSEELYDEALGNAERYRISFYDALIISGAREYGAKVLYSEDLADGQDYGGVRVVNPF